MLNKKLSLRTTILLLLATTIISGAIVNSMAPEKEVSTVSKQWKLLK